MEEDDKPRVPEPTNYKKLAKELVVSVVLINIILPTRYFLYFADLTVEQKVVISFLVFMIYALMVAFFIFAR